MLRPGCITRTALAVALGGALCLGSAPPARAVPRTELVTGAGLVRLTITNLGYVGNGLSSPYQPSCEYPSNSHVEHLFIGGLWVGAMTPEGLRRVSTGAQDASSLTDGEDIREFTDSLTEDVQIWSNTQNSDDYNPAALATEHIECYFTDDKYDETGNHTPLFVNVILRALSWSSSYADDFVILDYRIINDSGSELRDVYVGYWNDTTVGNTTITVPSGYGSGAPRTWQFYDDVNGALRPGDVADDPGPLDDVRARRRRRGRDGHLLDRGAPAGFRPGPVAGPGPAAGHLQQLALPLRACPGRRLRGRRPAAARQVPDALQRRLRRRRRLRLCGQLERPARHRPVPQPRARRHPAGDLRRGLRRRLPEPAGQRQGGAGGLRLGLRDPDRPALAAAVAGVRGQHGRAGLGSRRLRRPGRPGRARAPAAGRPAPLPEHHVSIITLRPDFQGYRIFRFQGESFGGDPYEQSTMVAQFDKIDGIGFDTGLPPLGTDGLRRFRDTSLLDGFGYWYSVVSFSAPDVVSSLPEFQSGYYENAELVYPGPAPRPLGEGRGPGVFPNPYRVASRFDDQQGELELGRKLWFTGLPARCVIKVFTLNGDLVKTLHHDDPASGLEPWDILSEPVRAIASGLYIFAVEDLATGRVERGKLVIIK
ncbi:MAG: hypothetical protein IPI34_10980 [bacterium]|nr:hypothetical protein [bacterium]